jgi:hypothetical protein
MAGGMGVCGGPAAALQIIEVPGVWPAPPWVHRATVNNSRNRSGSAVGSVHMYASQT